MAVDLCRGFSAVLVPVVFVDREPSSGLANAVSSDNRAGAAHATGHLVRHGHRRIAFLGDRMGIQTASERHRGFFDTLGAAGIPAGEAVTVTELHDAGGGEAAMQELLASADPPAAVFSAQNLIMISVLHALRKDGRAGSTALVGFDDLPLADLLEPGVNVISPDPQEIGRLAAARIFARLGGDESDPQRILVPTRLIQRGSGEIGAPR